MIVSQVQVHKVFFNTTQCYMIFSTTAQTDVIIQTWNIDFLFLLTINFELWALEVFWGVFQIVIFLAFFNPWRSARHFTLSNFSITSKDQFLFQDMF